MSRADNLNPSMSKPMSEPPQSAASTNQPNELSTALRNGRVLAVILICLAVVFVYGYVQRAQEAQQLRAEIVQMEANIEAARLRTAALESELRYAASDVYLDKIAREELGMAKPGETALIVVDPATGEQSAQANTAPSTDSESGATFTHPGRMPMGSADNADNADNSASVDMSGSTESTASPPWQMWLDLFSIPTTPNN